MSSQAWTGRRSRCCGCAPRPGPPRPGGGPPAGCPRARPRTRRRPPGARAGRRTCRGARRAPPPSGTGSFSSPRKTPHSLMVSPRSRARPRSRTWCDFDPVKWWSAVAKSSSGSTRRSTWSPSSIRTEHLLSPCPSTSRTPDCRARTARTGSASGAEATRSTSETSSHQRRTLPATLGPDHARGGAHLGEQRVGDREHVPEPAAGVGRAVLLDAGEDLLLAPLPEALQPADPLVAAGLLQLVDAPDAQRACGARRPSSPRGPGSRSSSRMPGGNSARSCSSRVQAPGPVELGDLLRQGGADVGQLGEAALAHERVQVAAEAGHPVGAEVVGA